MTPARRLIPSLSALRALEALDRLGSASAVAEEMALTQSAISRQLQGLEEQLGVTLIRRDRKRLSLTSAAADYVVEVRAALNQIAQASIQLQVQPTGGSLNLAILPTFGMRWLVPRLPEFTHLHPDITVNLSTQLRPFSFDVEPFDAAIHFGQPDWRGTEALLLKTERVVPVAVPGLIAAAPDDPADLLKLPLLHIQTRPNAWQDWFANMGVAVSPPLPGMIYDQFSTITQAALHGLGVALMPEYLVEQELATGRLVPMHHHSVEANGAYYLIWPRTGSEDPVLKQFRDWLAQKAQPEDDLPR
ncbi:LysR family transcriptional regulator [Ruegeria hyattellae]|uniref:LysR family transcriptional regulator n=1 Tax=Ruegeria hyattellae TaxID=3233337 RepID=UPI00355C0A1E